MHIIRTVAFLLHFLPELCWSWQSVHPPEQCLFVPMGGRLWARWGWEVGPRLQSIPAPVDCSQRWRAPLESWSRSSLEALEKRLPEHFGPTVHLLEKWPWKYRLLCDYQARWDWRFLCCCQPDYWPHSCTGQHLRAQHLAAGALSPVHLTAGYGAGTVAGHPLAKWGWEEECPGLHRIVSPRSPGLL